jgi:hypothetical protein
VAAAILILFGLMFATGYALLLQFPRAGVLGAVAVIGFVWLHMLNRRIRP